eukprot:jgi/Botrbrau1/12302/Bobra.0205s0001.1
MEEGRPTRKCSLLYSRLAGMRLEIDRKPWSSGMVLVMVSQETVWSLYAYRVRYGVSQQRCALRAKTLVAPCHAN